MRHVMSLVMGIVVAPLVWVAVAVGQGATDMGFPDDRPFPQKLLVGGLLLVGVGVLAGLIVSLRTSPLGAMFAGIVFLAPSIYLYVDHVRGLHYFTTNWMFKGVPIDMSTPLTSGVLAFAGGVLIMSLFSAARWRGRSTESDDTWSPLPPEDDYSYR
jgi:hypothetical protein